MAKEGMRDVSAKSSSLRTAIASATLRVSPESIQLLRDGKAPKGDPLPVARVAAIQAAKNTAQIIPYCHPVKIDYVGVEFSLGSDTIQIRVEVKAIDRTGVEMEALTAAAAAALNLFDLLKPVDDAMRIEGIQLDQKTGGKSQFPAPDAFSAAIVVVSDSVSKGEKEDSSGRLMAQRLVEKGASVAPLATVPDEPDAIRAALEQHRGSDLLFLLGGTGAGPRDGTPEAAIPLLDRRLEGIEHRLHAFGQARLPAAMLGRPFAGLRNGTVVIGLPGSPGAASDAVDALFPYLTHVLHIVRGGGHDDGQA